MDGKTARGASSPANPALTRPEPLSHTKAVVSSSSHMFRLFCLGSSVPDKTRLSVINQTLNETMLHYVQYDETAECTGLSESSLSHAAG